MFKNSVIEISFFAATRTLAAQLFDKTNKYF